MNRSRRRRLFRATLLGAAFFAHVALVMGSATAQDTEERPPDVLAELAEQAAALEPLVESDAARALLEAVDALGPAEETKIYRASGGYLAEAYTRKEFAALDEAQRAELREVAVDTRLWYHTFYGSPLASVRAFDLAAQHGLETFDGKRVFDFGFGSLGQLELLAACGADVVGTEVMPALRALYAPYAGENPRLVFGRWPAEESVIEAVGDGFDLVISKNTIKRGYVAPPVEVNSRFLLDFGVEPEVFLQRLFAVLRPGGLVVFYNLGGEPAGPGEAYRPPTDIASPWSRAEYEAHGFEVLALDEDDTATAREVGFALGWEASMDLETALFASLTVLRRPR